jgi:predicted nucleic acid-binding protein
VRIVLDTNVVFSALLNPDGKISDFFLNPSLDFSFYAASFILEELQRHHSKLISISTLAEADIQFLKRVIFSKVTLIDLEVIRKDSWEKALTLVKGIDEFDAPFVALSIEKESFLWTGDKKLKKGLESLGVTWVVDTNQLLRLKS